ncbi:hypothetical protein G6F68_019626 [Rhizopus microsporus]|nr:hypothetical protein G6F68_019626 [Rhizopus microsporus]
MQTESGAVSSASGRLNSESAASGRQIQKPTSFTDLEGAHARLCSPRVRPAAGVRAAGVSPQERSRLSSRRSLPNGPGELARGG